MTRFTVEIAPLGMDRTVRAYSEREAFQAVLNSLTPEQRAQVDALEVTDVYC